ncbi:MAG: helix-turn-helix domain-containing protein [Proteobacteria bacterium]|nr:helix-turn-helix domain-containing protein [Pseudomonadota bacterium]
MTEVTTSTDARIQEAARMLSTGHGKTEIAKQFGISRQALYALMRKPEFKAAYEILQTEAGDCVKRAASILAEEAPEAARRLIELSRSTDKPGVAFKCLEAILERAGVQPEDSGHRTRAQFNIHIENFQAASNEELDKFLLERLNPILDVAPIKRR